MKYFTKITSQGYSAKNKLQESAKELMKGRDQMLLEDTEVDKWIADISNRIKALNDYFKRCSPLKYSFESAYNGTDYTFNCNEVFTITLYKVNNS